MKEIHRERAEFVKAIQKMSKPQTINGLFEERELMIDGGKAGQSLVPITPHHLSGGEANVTDRLPDGMR